MRKYKRITKRQLNLSMVTYSIFILVYWISFYELYTLCRFGRYKNNITVLLGCMVLFLALFIILIIRMVKRPAVASQQIVDRNEVYSRCKTRWTCTALIIIVLITGFYGVKIYHSAINYNGKLSWVLRDLKNNRTVKLEHTNIYESGIEGIFTDINKKIHMPEKLYIVNNFSLNFDTNGKITSFDTFLYGKNAKGESESYLISYNSNKSGNITIHLNGYAGAKYSEDKLLQPLFNTMTIIPLKKTVSSWPGQHYGILYSGKRSFGYNTDGIVYIDSKGDTKSAVNVYSEIIGYTVSVYVPGKEDKITPVRYNLTDSLNNIKTDEPSQDNKNSSDQSENIADEFYFSKQFGYRLEITGSAAGSRAYSLTGTTDGGLAWNTINADPFSGSLGAAVEMTFLNDKLGFICLSSNGGSKGKLYRTEDGSLNILVGQGSDGDHNGGSKALYQSKDNGITWGYINEVNKK
jgi:hypothetical protein